MKNIIKNAGLFFLIVGIYSLRTTAFDKIGDLIFLGVFISATVILYLIRNKYIAYGFSVTLLLLSSFYDECCVFFMMPAFLLIIIYRNLTVKLSVSHKKNQHNISSENAWLLLLNAFGAGIGFYSLVKIIHTNPDVYMRDFIVVPIILIILGAVFALGSFSKTVKNNVKKGYKMVNSEYSILSFINFVALFLFANNVLYNYAKYPELKFSFIAINLPWVVWLCVLVYEKNPIIDTMFELLEKKLRKVSGRLDEEK